MFPIGGFTMLIHLIINGIFGVVRFTRSHVFPNAGFVDLKNSLQKRSISVSVIIIVIISVTVSAGFVMRNVFTSETNYDLLTPYIYPCEPIQIDETHSRKKAVIRIDDVQAYAWAGISRLMIDDAIENDFPVTLGVIPNELKSDKKMYGYLRSVRCNVEFAVHGWDNQVDRSEYAEFQNLSESEAKERIRKGIKVLERLSQKEVTTFIPPNNIYSSGTREALQDLEVTVISSEGSGRFDYDASTYDFESNSMKSAESVIRRCGKVWKNEDMCVIMLHPQDFATDGKLDSDKYMQYRKLLNLLKERDISVVRFEDIVNK